jgi:hypothetical protein
MKIRIALFVILMAALLTTGACTTETPAGSGDIQTSTPATPSAEEQSEELFLELLEPSEETTSASRITVSGQTLPDAVVSINGDIIYVDYRGIFTAQVNLEAGPNVIEVIASDFYGNEKFVVVPVIYVAALPLTITEPLDESVVTSSSVIVRGETNADAIVSINGKMASVDASGNFSESVTLDPGPNLIEVLASDFSDNSAAVIVTVIYTP